MNRHPGSITAEEIRNVTLEDDHISKLTTLVIHGWLSTRRVTNQQQPYQPFRDNITVIDGMH